MCVTQTHSAVSIICDNLISRVFLCYTLITKTNESPDTLRSNLSKIKTGQQPL